MKKILTATLTQLTLAAPALAQGGYKSTAVDTSGFAFTDIGTMIAIMVQTIIIVSGLAAFIFLIIGGFQYLTSGGDKVQAQGARDRITYAILGLVIVVAAIAIANILGAVFGVNILGNIQFPGPKVTVGK